MDHLHHIKVIREYVELLAAGDEETLTDEQYSKLADECSELSLYLESIAEGYRIAASPECTALLAEVCKKISEDKK